MTDREQIISALVEQFPQVERSEFRGQVRVIVPRDDLLNVLGELKGQHGFDMLVDITCVDYLHFRGANRESRPINRFGLVYLLANTVDGQRITLRVMLDESDLVVGSVVSLWEGANWMEREVWDMFGVKFDGHPDLRRILLPEEFTAHPLRKDYPLQGRGERHNFPVITRGQA